MTALVGVMGSACVGAPDPSVDPSVDEEATREAAQAYVTLFTPGASFSCTLPGRSPTGWEWATLTVALDRKTCYLSLDYVRLDPAPSRAQQCYVFYRMIGCEDVLPL
ncbi:hypothetical protein [Sorangium sp. So ce1078]|uniref:hypothetical protein n=1 Tax=Sorangium sp. So ce1078 TaxID=3133329 RepID=UPI003F5ED209